MTVQMDPYKVLGVSQDAQIQEIRQAHRKLVLKCHPDKVQDPQQKAIKQDEFQRVQEAYEILSDEAQREKYDDQIKLAELRRQYQNKPNTSAPRSTKYPDVEIRTAAEPRPKSYREGPPPPPQGVKVSYTYSRSHEEMRGPRYYEAEVRVPRRGESYNEAKPSKREAEKEREKKDEKERRKRKEAKEREKRERDEEDARRAAKKEEKRQRERREAKEKKSSKEEKRRDREPQHPYIEDDYYEEPQPVPRKPSRKHDDPRERSSGRDEPKLRRSATETAASKADAAREYIHRHRARDGSGLERSQSYHAPQPPAAPTPPPTAGGVPIFPLPEEEPIHRSSARPRRGSNDGPYAARERPMHRASQDPVRDDPILAHDSPAARSAPRYAEAPLGSSPPRVSRTNTVPIPVRPGPPPQRSQTYTEDRSANRGRGRSKLHAQHELDESEDEYYEEPRRSGKHRSSRKTRSPEHKQPSPIRYKWDGTKTTQYEYPEQRRTYYGAGADYVSYEPARSHYPAFRESKPIRHDDVHYSDYTRGAYGTAQA